MTTETLTAAEITQLRWAVQEAESWAGACETEADRMAHRTKCADIRKSIKKIVKMNEALNNLKQHQKNVRDLTRTYGATDDHE